MRAAVKNLREELGDSAQNPTYNFNEPRVGYRTPAGKMENPKNT